MLYIEMCTMCMRVGGCNPAESIAPRRLLCHVGDLPLCIRAVIHSAAINAKGRGVDVPEDLLPEQQDVYGDEVFIPLL